MEVVNGLNVASGYIHYLYNHTIGCSKLTECLYEESRQAKSSLGRKEDEIGQSIWQTIWQPVVSIPGWEKILSTLAKEHLYNHITGSSQLTVALPSMALLCNLYNTENRVFTCQQQTLVYYKALHNVNKRWLQISFLIDLRSLYMAEAAWTTYCKPQFSKRICLNPTLFPVTWNNSRVIFCWNCVILRGNFDSLPKLQIQILKHQWVACDL